MYIPAGVLLGLLAAFAVAYALSFLVAWIPVRLITRKPLPFRVWDFFVPIVCIFLSYRISESLEYVGHQATVPIFFGSAFAFGCIYFAVRSAINRESYAK